MNAEHRTDLLVGVALYVVHQEHRAVSLGQRVDRAVEPGPEVRIAGGGGPADLGGFVQRRLALPEP